MSDGFGWTLGAEHELVDWDRRRTHTWALDQRDVTMVNNNAIAVDPRARVYHLGGEVNTRPSDSASGQADQLAEFRRQFPEAAVNYRSNLHVHVRIPGLRDRLSHLKQIQKFCSDWLPKVLPLIEPIPEPMLKDYPSMDAWRGARKRYARRKVSHQKIMPRETVARQMKARTFQEFIDAEALDVRTGKLHWNTKPRCAVNIRQLVQTDTIEFRHFPGTLEPSEVRSACDWCRDFLQLALAGGDPVRHWRPGRAWPEFCKYDHRLEVGYLSTAVHLVGEEAARQNIAAILRKRR